MEIHTGTTYEDVDIRFATNLKYLGPLSSLVSLSLT